MSLIELFRRQPADALAILSPDRPPLRYGAPAEQAGRAVASLNARGAAARGVPGGNPQGRHRQAQRIGLAAKLGLGA